VSTGNGMGKEDRMELDGMGWDGGGGRRGKEEGQSLVTVSLSRVTQQPLLQGSKKDEQQEHTPHPQHKIAS
jgi:hypothetical protein